MAKKKILIVSESHLIKTFVAPTLKQLKKEYDLELDCFIISPLSDSDWKLHHTLFSRVISNEYIKGKLTKLRKVGILFSFSNLIGISKSLDQYDIIHIHYHHWYLALISGILRKKTNKLYLSFFGSDFNQVGMVHHLCNKKTIDLADGIFTTNPVFLKKIFQYYQINPSSKSSGILFPLMNSFKDFKYFLDNWNYSMANENLGFNKKVITGGYNGAKIVQHEQIWEAIKQHERKLTGFKIVFPMTYGTGKAESIATLKTKIKDSTLDVRILEEYLNLEDLKKLRLATDIFIHIQTRDQFSASMLEHLAAGSVAIIGKWLPYDLLIDKGIYAIWIESPTDLPEALGDVLSNLDFHKSNAKRNREIVFEIVSWDTIKKNWVTQYELEK
ncbi:glycosyltransferase [Cecembia lonarensis]|uniref:Glycosyltransferase subfamily 4-like N-terminal domain-containing protein n=1 Tax=Cecembia lonarensis (strain CCUG 58316 / KCTC 22772 / LW9) TaxID=1225176 RepID=K1LWR7_CECL9|nr:glycosyltransferase [Cecembia lonarensis]EKB48614.1 hypothetical protein B879_02772 [Cecembia lonarensis LW9]